MNPLQQSAVAYCKAGFFPIRIATNGKRPLDSGWQHARPDVDTASNLFSGHSGNIGITFPEDLFALDLDRKNGHDGVTAVTMLAANLGPLPVTLTATIPGGGEHRIFRLPPGEKLRNRTAVAPGIDIRATGGQIVAQPSTINGRPYTWQDWSTPIAEIPPNWLEFLRITAATPSVPPRPETSDPGMIPEGRRNDILFRKASSLRANGFNADEIEKAVFSLNLRSCSPPLPPHEIANIATSAAKYPPGPDLRSAFGHSQPENSSIPPPPPNSQSYIWTFPQPISPEEFGFARPAPDCIVESFLFADVALLIAPGGTGKTTFMLYQAVHIALGIPIFGRAVRKPGPVLILTAEDSRELLIARLRSIIETMTLGQNDRRQAMNLIRISDVSGTGFRLTQVAGEIVVPSANVDQVITGCQEVEPVLIVIDPAISFGVGETRVNDAEQGFIEAGRRMRNALGCCVQYVHHSGKQNGRDKAIDQYAGRGGSAFADGARMVHVMQPLDSDEWCRQANVELGTGENGLILALPKMSYCPPQDAILIRRSGYRFTHVAPESIGSVEIRNLTAEKIWKFLSDEFQAGHMYTKNTLEDVRPLELSRPKLRNSVNCLLDDGRLEERPRPDAGANGARKYLHPLGSPEGVGEAKPE